MTRLIQDIHTELTVATGAAPKRLDVFLTSHEACLSRSAVQRLTGTGRITVNTVCKGEDGLR